jgi:hypothetical protein
MPNVFNIPNFIGGVNEHIDKSLLKLSESYKAENCSIDDGNLSVCKGYANYIPAPLASPIETLIAFYKSNSGTLIFASGGKLYKCVDGITTELLSGLSSNKVDYINFQIQDTDVLIFGNGIDSTKVYDGTAFRDLKNRRVEYQLDSLGNPVLDASGEKVVVQYVDGNGAVHPTEGTITTLAPKCKYIGLHYERLWATGDSSRPNCIYFSSAFDPDDWTAPVDEIEANQHGGEIELPTWDGGIIIGLSVIFNDVVVFKTKNIFRIFGTYPGNYQREQLFSTNGCISDKSIISANMKAYFAATEGIFAYDGANVNNISSRIQNTWDSFSQAQKQNSVAVFYDDKYILSVPDASTVIEYDTLNNNFMIRKGMCAVSFIEFNGELLFSDKTGMVYRYGSGNKYVNNSITASWHTGTSTLGSPNSIKVAQYIYFEGSGDGDIKITCVTDKQEKYITVPLDSSVKMYKNKLKAKGRVLSLKFENVNGSYFSIKSPQLSLDIDYD